MIVKALIVKAMIVKVGAVSVDLFLGSESRLWVPA